MARILRIDPLKVPAVGASPERTPYSAPGGTTGVIISTPTPIMVQITDDAVTPFRARQLVTFTRQPTAGELLHIGQSAGLPHTWVTGIPTGLQIKIGTDIAASIGNAIAALNAAGFDCSMPAAGQLRVLGPNDEQALGPSGDMLFVVKGAGYLLNMPLNSVSPFFGGTGLVLPAGVSQIIPATTNLIVWARAVTGTVASDPTFDLGASVSWVG